MFIVEKITPKKIVFKLVHNNNQFCTLGITTDQKISVLQTFKRKKNGACYLDIHSGFVDVQNAEDAKTWLATHCYRIIFHDGSAHCIFAYTDKEGFIQEFNKRDESLPQVAVNLREM